MVKSFDKLNLARQIIVIDLVFNNGEAGLRKFVATLAAIEKADFEKAADEMQDSDWFTQVGDRGPRNVLARRTGALEACFQQTLNAIERADAKAGSKEGRKEGKEGKEASKDSKDSKEAKERVKEGEEGKDGKDTKDTKDGKGSSPLDGRRAFRAARARCTERDPAGDGRSRARLAHAPARCGARESVGVRGEHRFASRAR